jgi:rRNA maturation endonuclease Nob1
MKLKIFCWECDTEFKVTYPGGDPLHYCPCCGTELEVDDEDEEAEEE